MIEGGIGTMNLGMRDFQSSATTFLYFRVDNKRIPVVCHFLLASAQWDINVHVKQAHSGWFGFAWAIRSAGSSTHPPRFIAESLLALLFSACQPAESDIGMVVDTS